MEKVPSLAEQSLMEYQHPDETRTQEDLCSLFAEYERFTDEELGL
jgi:hypothetical protein